MQLMIRESAATVRLSLCLMCRLLVVLFEGHDFCCYQVTGRSVLEICEVGEHGGLVTDFDEQVQWQHWNATQSCN